MLKVTTDKSDGVESVYLSMFVNNSDVIADWPPDISGQRRPYSPQYHHLQQTADETAPSKMSAKNNIRKLLTNGNRKLPSVL